MARIALCKFEPIHDCEMDVQHFTVLTISRIEYTVPEMIGLTSRHVG